MKITLALSSLLLITVSSGCKKYFEDRNFCRCAEQPTIVWVDTVMLTIPNIITPNGDGFNDDWHIINLDKLPPSILKITKSGLTKYNKTSSFHYFSDAGNGLYKYSITVNDLKTEGIFCSYRGSAKPVLASEYDCLTLCYPLDAGDPVLYP